MLQPGNARPRFSVLAAIGIAEPMRRYERMAENLRRADVVVVARLPDRKHPVARTA